MKTAFIATVYDRFNNQDLWEQNVFTRSEREPVNNDKSTIFE